MVDVGANIGVYTAALSRLVGASGRVTSFEPIPETFDILRHNVSALRLSNVRIINRAVLESSGSTRMVVPEEEPGEKNFYRAQVVEPSESPRGDDGPPLPSSSDVEMVPVRAVTLDETLEGDAPVTFLKLDVEGSELRCLTGARRLIEHARPAMLVEVGEHADTQGSTARQVCLFLESRGYRPWRCVDGMLRPREPHDQAVNLFFLTRDHEASVLQRQASRHVPV